MTRGQDLSGKDFSGQTLIKQDFKTVHFSLAIFVFVSEFCCCFYHTFYGNWILMQSILRMANFKGAKLLGASFFDADLTGIHMLDFVEVAVN